jgi:hypothetical protein
MACEDGPSASPLSNLATVPSVREPWYAPALAVVFAGRRDGRWKCQLLTCNPRSLALAPLVAQVAETSVTLNTRMEFGGIEVPDPAEP